MDVSPTGDARTVWVLSAVIEATQEGRDAAQEAIARALCPEDFHEGPCPVPWVTYSTRLEDLDEEQQRSWRESFAEDRVAQQLIDGHQ